MTRTGVWAPHQVRGIGVWRAGHRIVGDGASELGVRGIGVWRAGHRIVGDGASDYEGGGNGKVAALTSPAFAGAGSNPLPRGEGTGMSGVAEDWAAFFHEGGSAFFVVV